MLERKCTHVAIGDYFGVSHDTIARRIKKEGIIVGVKDNKITASIKQVDCETMRRVAEGYNSKKVD